MRELVTGVMLVLLLGGAAGATEVIVHRGVHQQMDRSRVAENGCEAQHALPFGLDHLDTTMAFMRDAFEAGADWVETDLQVTAGGQLVVSGGSGFDCRSESSGSGAPYTLGSLLPLDAGYGYRADGGQASMLRCDEEDSSCRQPHRSPTMREVLAAFPQGGFILHLDSQEPGEADLVIARLKAWMAEGRLKPGRLMFFSSQDPEINVRMQAELPQIAVPVLVREQIDHCSAGFAWGGLYPDECAGADVAVSVERMDALGPRAQFLSAAVHRMGGVLHIHGVNSPAAYTFAVSLSPDFIWTEHIEALGL